LATAAWITVDDTGGRHRHQNGFCTQIGNDHFAALASAGPKSRRNFLEVLRASDRDYIVNAEALAYMRRRPPAGPVIARLAQHPQRRVRSPGGPARSGCFLGTVRSEICGRR
jgi:hypothetical protein